MKNIKFPEDITILNGDTYNTFKPSPRLPYKIQKRIKSVQLKPISQDEEYKRRATKEMDLKVNSAEIYENGQRPQDGIFSPLFGADMTQEAPVYSCDCHRRTGKQNAGKICPYCSTEVRTIEADLRMCLYIDTEPYHVLSYIGYIHFRKYFDQSKLDEILGTCMRINRMGFAIPSKIPTIMSLYDDYDELYKPKIKLPKKIVFMTKIPVYSMRLRPLMHNAWSPKMTILDVNKRYLSIVRLNQNIKVIPVFGGHINQDVEIQRTLNAIQKELIDIYHHVESQVNGKNGVFRQFLASGRVDYSSRMVITLGPKLQPHEIDIPYQTAMTIYEEEIANYMSHKYQISLSQAIDEVRAHATQRDETFVSIINGLLEKGTGIWALINRPPSISKSSILYCKVRKIHDENKYSAGDMTMHLPSDILSLLAADFNPKTRGTIRVHMIVISYQQFSERLTSGVYCIQYNMLTVRVG